MKLIENKYKLTRQRCDESSAQTVEYTDLTAKYKVDSRHPALADISRLYNDIHKSVQREELDIPKYVGYEVQMMGLNQTKSMYANVYIKQAFHTGSVKVVFIGKQQIVWKAREMLGKLLGLKTKPVSRSGSPGKVLPAKRCILG